MNKCPHKAENYTGVCPHIFADTSVDNLEGVKEFTGNARDAKFFCKSCYEDSPVIDHQLCDECVKTIDSSGEWEVEGLPGVIRNPQPFRFERRELTFGALAAAEIKQFAPFNASNTKAIVFNSDGQLWLVDIVSGESDLLTTLASEKLDRTGDISLCLSPDDQYLAITSLVYNRREANKASNKGLVLLLPKCEVCLHLDCGDYHTEEAQFPVTFIQDGKRNLLVHATDWNRLDITDLSTGECLTNRNLDDMPEAEAVSGQHDILGTEWSGRLLPSPDQHRIATIGWVWHPVGLAFSWSVKDWFNNIWEADCGPSKRSYAMWEYFWYSPFVWLDNKRLCIWGYDRIQPFKDMPTPSAAVYDAESGKLLHFFVGPTMDVFYFDEFLFSGLTADESNTVGISVWSVDDGSLLHEQKDIRADAYHPGTKEFVTIEDDGNWSFHRWQAPKGV
ncbi:MAG: hypothetical protein HKM24_06160 [Gammaproteobacteria bacterium]|nr:hypothetical protein [Gammaproteobacteria bacterium]